MAKPLTSALRGPRFIILLGAVIICLMYYYYTSSWTLSKNSNGGSKRSHFTSVKKSRYNAEKVKQPAFGNSPVRNPQAPLKQPDKRLTDEEPSVKEEGKKKLPKSPEKVENTAAARTAERIVTSSPKEKQNPADEEKKTPVDTNMPEWERKVKSNPNWIVVGTIHDPTEPVRTMAAQPGWSVCVVGDFKTPKNWKMDLDNVVFLSLERQEELGFKIHKKMPFGIYGRKNMGYMFVIKHGAKVIYDTDDDNELIVDSLSDAFILDPKAQLKRDSMLVYQPLKQKLSTQRLLVNPYAHFGQANLWPRGLPLSCLQPEYMRKYIYRGAYREPGTSLRPLVQQGLANGDPDIDAVYRLTRKRNSNKIDITFDPDAPGVTLPPNVLAPFNAQNTLYHYDAFWGLMLSVTTTFRVTDIWRSYWMQRILWDIGGTLSFQIPSVYQDRNEHNYFLDFVEEYRLYNNTGKLTKFLLEWDPPKGDIYARLQVLADELFKRKFWLEGDAELMKAWIEDLKTVGYKPPEIMERSSAFSKLYGPATKYVPREMPTTFVSTLGARGKSVQEVSGQQNSGADHHGNNQSRQEEDGTNHADNNQSRQEAEANHHGNEEGRQEEAGASHDGNGVGRQEEARGNGRGNDEGQKEPRGNGRGNEEGRQEAVESNRHGNNKERLEEKKSNRHGNDEGRQEVRSNRQGNDEGRQEEVRRNRRGNDEGRQEVRSNRRGNDEGRQEEVTSNHRGNDEGRQEVKSNHRGNDEGRQEVTNNRHGNDEGGQEEVTSNRRGNDEGGQEEVRSSRHGNDEGRQEVTSDHRGNDEGRQEVTSNRHGNDEGGQEEVTSNRRGEDEERQEEVRSNHHGNDEGRQEVTSNRRSNDEGGQGEVRSNRRVNDEGRQEEVRSNRRGNDEGRQEVTSNHHGNDERGQEEVRSSRRGNDEGRQEEVRSSRHGNDEGGQEEAGTKRRSNSQSRRVD